MKGQWIGTYQGSVEGKIMVNVDEVEDHYEVVVYINPTEKGIPASVAYVVTANKRLEQQVVAYISPVDPRTGFQCTWDKIKDLYAEGVSHSEKADITLRLEGGKLHIDSTILPPLER